MLAGSNSSCHQAAPDQYVGGGGPGHHADDSGINVLLCQVCQGSGLMTEVYEHRRLESTCAHCQGDGMIIMGGTDQQPAERGKQQPCSSITAAPIRKAGAGDSCTTGLPPGAAHKHRLQRQASKLLDKIERVTQEADDMQAQLDVQPGGTQQHMLQAEVLRQLRAHVVHLQAMHAGKVQQLKRACG